MITVAIIIAVITACAPAWAEEERLPDRFMLRLGGYQIRDADTIVRLEKNNQPGGAYIDFDETLGGETSAMIFRLDGLYRFNERHTLMIGYRALSSDYSQDDLRLDTTTHGPVIGVLMNF